MMTARTLAEGLYRRLRAEILTGRIPPGSRLKLAELQARYQASMGVVREALIRLAGEELVQSEPQVGFRVTPLSPDALHELTEARVAIECLVFGQAVQHGDTAWEGRIVASHHVLARTTVYADDGSGLVTSAWDEAHLAFHRALLDGCPNKRLRQIADAQRVSADLYRWWSQTLGGPMAEGAPERDIHGEHRELLAAALDRDQPRATTSLASHIRRTAEVLLQRYRANG